MLIFSWTIVASSLMVIWNPPSPTTDPDFGIGLGKFRANRGGSAKPIVPSPPEVISVRVDCGGSTALPTFDAGRRR